MTMLSLSSLLSQGEERLVTSVANEVRREPVEKLPIDVGAERIEATGSIISKYIFKCFTEFIVPLEDKAPANWKSVVKTIEYHNTAVVQGELGKLAPSRCRFMMKGLKDKKTKWMYANG